MAVTLSFSDLQVLLVEPSHMQAQLVRRMLQNLGIEQIDVCDRASDALALMQKQPPSVVISSLYLPDMPGTALVETMREDEELERVPFILISSETRPQVLEPVRQSGACSIVAKPFTEVHLARALNFVADMLAPEVALDASEVERMRVLLVDDSMASRRHIRRLLEGMGVHDILEAINGKEAVKLLADTMVDLVLTDYNMPEMDGKTLVEYIRTQSWQASVPILMLTSEQDQGRLAAVERAGVSAICDKPFEGESIRQIIAQALSD